jgi:hypothetical protein
MGVEAPGVRVLAVKLERMPLTLRSRLRPIVKAGASSVAARAKANAAWSYRIPGAISVRSQLGSDATGVGATVSVSAAKAPEARVLERGNTNSTSTTSFKHPVFGGDTWVSQPMRPFLFPAMAAKRSEIEAGITAAIEAAQRDL